MSRRTSDDATSAQVNAKHDCPVAMDRCVDLMCSSPASMLTHRGRFLKTCQLVWTTLIPAVALIVYSTAEFAIDAVDYGSRQRNLRPNSGDVQSATACVEMIRRVQSLRLIATMYLGSGDGADVNRSNPYGDTLDVVADFLQQSRDETVSFIAAGPKSSTCDFDELFAAYDKKIGLPLRFLSLSSGGYYPSMTTSFCSAYDYAASSVGALVNYTLRTGTRGNVLAADIGSTFRSFTRVVGVLNLNCFRRLNYTGKHIDVTTLIQVSKSLVVIEEAYAALQAIGTLHFLDADGGKWGFELRNMAIGEARLAEENFRRIRSIGGKVGGIRHGPTEDVRSMIDDILSAASLSSWLTANEEQSGFVRQQSVVLARWIDGFQNLIQSLFASTNSSLKDVGVLVEYERRAIGKWIGLGVFDWILMFLVLVPLVLVNAARNMAAVQAYTTSFESKELELRLEKRKTEALLNEMLPRSVRLKLQRGDSTATLAAEQYDSATVYFSDVTDFAELSAMYNPMQVIIILNEIYSFMDDLIPRFDVYKVETISCVYMVVSGVPTRNGSRHAAEIARMSLDIIRASEKFRIESMPDFRLSLRIGIHTGPVVAGIVGNKMPRYCLFGDTVNTASRMQSNGLAHQIHVSEATYRFLCNYDDFTLKSRGTITIKGKGDMNTYWLLLDKTQENVFLEG